MYQQLSFLFLHLSPKVSVDHLPRLLFIGLNPPPFIGGGSFLGPHLKHMEVPRLGVKSKLQLPTTATATATPDLSLAFNLHPSSQQHWILSPLSKARG